MKRLLSVLSITCLCLFAAMLAGNAAGQQTRWPSSNPPRPLAARDVKFPPYQLQTLPNGLQVMAVLHHEQPVVSIRMIVRAGGALDPVGKNGLADLAASVLTQGAGGKSANELNETVDFMGAVLGAGAGVDLSFVNMIVMKDGFEAGLSILSDVVRRPNFASEEIERQRQQMLSSLQVSFESPEFIADAVFRRLVYGLHPYGMPQTGTPESLAAITREDLLAFHRRNFAPNNAILAIVGDLTDAEAFEGVKKIFGDWERRDVQAGTLTPPPDPARRIVIVNKPDAVQTEVRVGHLGVRRNHNDYMALNLAIRILGGEGANRLHQVLRTERGLTYGASADFDTLRESGTFEASTNTRSEATGEVLRLMVDEFWRLQRERVGERELGDAKAYLTGSFPLTIETPDAIATQVLNVLFYGLPVEQLESFRQRVNGISVDEVERVSRYYLRPDRLSIVLVGNVAAFQGQLRKLGFDKIETIEMSELDLTSADFRKARRLGGVNPSRDEGERIGRSAVEAFRLARTAAYQAQSAAQRQPGVTAEEGPAALALIDKAIAAKGGLEKLRAIKAIKAVTQATMTAPEGKVEAHTTTYLEYPNRMRVETKLRDATIVQTFDGSHAWVKDRTGTHEVPARMIADLEATFRRDAVAALLAAHDRQLRVRLLPNVKDEGGKLHQAVELSGPKLDPMVMYVDPESGQITKLSYIANGPGKPLVEEIFSDHKTVDGVQGAFTANVRQGGREVVVRRIISIEINPSLDPVLFQRPSS
jgi:zinc protease